MILQPIIPLVYLLVAGGACVGGAIVAVVRLRHNKVLLVPWLRKIGLLALIIVMAMRPSVPGAQLASGTSLLDILFVVDRTLSSAAEDYNGNKQRLEGIKQDAKDISAQLPGARVSLMTFSNIAVTELPLTDDASAFTTAIDAMSVQEDVYAKGSSIDSALDKLTNELNRIKSSSPGRGRLVFYFGDGEQTAKAAIKSFSGIKPNITGGAVLGYGTQTGGNMMPPMIYSTLPPQYLETFDPNAGQYGAVVKAVSKINETNLKTVASDMGVPYFHRTTPGGIDQLIKDIQVQKIIDNSKDIESYNDLYWIIAPVPIVLLCIESWLLYSQYAKLRIVRKKLRGVN